MTNEELVALGKKNLEKLKDLYDSDSTVVPFVGAGPSIPIGINGWSVLLEKMIEDFSLEASEFRELFSSDQLSQVASKIYSKINAEDYKNYLSSKLRGVSANYIDLHIKTIKLFNIIITTNFDNAFDDAADDLEKEFNRQIMPTFNILDMLVRNTIVYLHGHIETGNLIFRDEDYSIFYDEQNLAGYAPDIYDLVKALAKNTHIVFIGFSFRDRYFTNLFNRIVNEDLIDAFKSIEKHFGKQEQEHKCHFAFMPLPDNNEEAIQLYKVLEKMNILTIFYEGTHSQVGAYLKLLKPTQVKSDIEQEALHV